MLQVCFLDQHPSSQIIPSSSSTTWYPTNLDLTCFPEAKYQPSTNLLLLNGSDEYAYSVLEWIGWVRLPSIGMDQIGGASRGTKGGRVVEESEKEVDSDLLSDACGRHGPAESGDRVICCDMCDHDKDGYIVIGTLLLPDERLCQAQLRRRRSMIYGPWRWSIYLKYIGNDVWNVIQNGNLKKRIATGKDGVVRILPPVSAIEIHAVEKERKGPQKPEISDSDDKSTEHSTCQSNDSKGSCGNIFDHSSESESESISVPNEMSTSKSVITNEKVVSLYDEQMNQLGEQEAKILAYTLAVKKLEAQIVTFQKQQLSLNEQLTFQANEIYAKDEKLKRYRRIGMKAVKEKEQLKKTVDSWKDSSKNLWKLIDSGMSSTSKVGLGYEIKSNNEVLSYEEEMNRSVFKCTEEDYINKPLYSRFTKTNSFKGVPHPLTGDYTPKPQEEIDDSLYVYGKKGPQKPEISDSDDNSTEHSTCQSNDSEGSCGNTSEHSSESESESISVPNEMSTSKSVITNEKVVSELQEVEPSCAKHIKTPRQQMKNQGTSEVKGKNWNKMMERELGEGYSFIKKKCFVCGSLSHLIKDCDYYEKKMAREAEFKKQRVFNTGNRVAKPVWTNANRVNHANQFVPRPVQLNAGRPNINSVRPNINTGRTNVNSVRPNINTGRTNVNSVRPKVNTVSSNVNTVRSRQPVPTRTSNSFSPKRPHVNQFNQRRHFSKSYSPVRRPIDRNTTKMSYFNAVKGNWSTVVKTLAGYNWRNSSPNSNCDSGPTFIRTVNAKGPQGRPKPVKAWVPKRN
ncbi:hypothetical protein Tco_0090122 [Tanacetum coccineum]